MKKERIAYIDFIEFIAVFLVVFCHYTETAGTTVVDHIAFQFTTTIAVPLCLWPMELCCFHRSLTGKNI